jgi:Tol biopolymer transport system component/DNA-binding winged helix-turn-helix (wHTH) protein
MHNEGQELLAFGSFEFDSASRVLRRGGELINLPPKTFDLLVLFVESGGALLTKREIIQALWPDTFVEDANLSFQVSALRRALGDEGSGWIETVPKHGYRFRAPIRRPPETAPADSSPAPKRGGLRRRALALGTILAAGVAVAVYYWLTTGPRTESERLSITQLTAYPGSEVMPALSPDGSRVAFAWDGPNEDNFDIYVQGAGPGDPVRLTNDPAPDLMPAWSPDGREIAFSRELEYGKSGIYIKPAMGGAERKITEHWAVLRDPQVRRSPVRRRLWQDLAWSPDGSTLAFGGRMAPDGPWAIWGVSVQTGQVRRLSTPPVDVTDRGPAFSPDARYLAFLRVVAVTSADIYVQPLKNDLSPEGAAARLTSEHRTLGGPVWEPDGRSLMYSSGVLGGIRVLKRLLLTRDRMAVRAAEILPYGEQTTAMTTPVRGRVVLAKVIEDENIYKVGVGANAGNTPAKLIASTMNDHTPAWSPDGQHIAFASARSGREEIWVCNADGSNAVQMTQMDSPTVANPRFSPDGRSILFNARKEGNSDLYMVDLATSALRKLTTSAADEIQPQFSRDGASVYFASYAGARFEIWKMQAGGGPAEQITTNGGNFAEESADAKLLFYAAAGAIWSVPISGGSAVRIVDGLSYATNFAVTKDGIYYLSTIEGSRRSTVKFWDFRTKQANIVLTIEKRWAPGLSISPDGRSLLITVVDQEESDLVMIERTR